MKVQEKFSAIALAAIISNKRPLSCNQSMSQPCCQMTIYIFPQFKFFYAFYSKFNFFSLCQFVKISQYSVIECILSLLDNASCFYSSYIWVKFLKVYIFPKYCHFFCNFDSCFRALFALVRLFQLFLRVNHMCHSRENQVFDPSPQVRYLKKTSKHGRF